MVNIDALYNIIRIKKDNNISVDANRKYIEQMSTFISNLPSFNTLKGIDIKKPNPYMLFNDRNNIQTMSYEEIFLNAEERNQYVLCKKGNE